MIDRDFWAGRRVLVTGHTGFKGTWLTLWLQTLGAEVAGFSRRPFPDPEVESLRGDIRDGAAVAAAVEATRPEVVVHLAGSATVQSGLADPIGTYEVNVLGTANLLEATRACEATRVALSVTSDKIYHLGRGMDWAYTEDDRLGGSNPYASSKACQELVTAAFREVLPPGRGLAVASARAGNVIGGGDWTPGRLVPDLIRSGLAGTPLEVRAPDAVRPWQHVLNPLEGYLQLVQRLWDDPSFACAWNFGPPEDEVHPVRWLVERLRTAWPQPLELRMAARPPRHESAVPRVDSSRARDLLHWRPPWNLAAAVDATVEWHLAHRDGAAALAISREQIERFAAAREIA